MTLAGLLLGLHSPMPQKRQTGRRRGTDALIHTHLHICRVRAVAAVQPHAHAITTRRGTGPVGHRPISRGHTAQNAPRNGPQLHLLSAEMDLWIYGGDLSRPDDGSGLAMTQTP